MDYNIKIGKRLQELRNELGLTQLKLADILNVDRRKIARLELGTTCIDADCLIKLSHIFNTSTDYLLCLTDKKEKYPEESITL